VESVNVMIKNLKTRTFRFKMFNPQTGRIENSPNGGILMLWWTEGDKILAKMSMCPKDKVFHKPTAVKIAESSCVYTLQGTDALDVVFAKSIEGGSEVRSFMCEIIDSFAAANTNKEDFNNRMKFSESSVYKYVN